MDWAAAGRGIFSESPVPDCGRDGSSFSRHIRLLFSDECRSFFCGFLVHPEPASGEGTHLFVHKDRVACSAGQVLELVSILLALSVVLSWNIDVFRSVAAGGGSLDGAGTAGVFEIFQICGESVNSPGIFACLPAASTPEGR